MEASRTLNLHLDPDTEAKLRKQAAEAGKDPEAYARDAVLEKLEGRPSLAEIPLAEILAPVHE